MNRLYWRKGAPHRRILIVLTAREEEGLVGAKYLAETYPEIFSNVAISLTMDGPLDLRSNYPADSIVAVVATKEASLSPYRRCIELVKAYCGETKLGFSTTEYGLGLGDFAAFPEIAKAGLHLRSPVRGWHDKERVKVDDLLNHTDLLCYLLLNWDRPDR